MSREQIFVKELGSVQCDVGRLSVETEIELAESQAKGGAIILNVF